MTICSYKHAMVGDFIRELSAAIPYVCDGCGRRRPMCDGADDDMPDHCDRCWAEAHAPLWRRVLAWVGFHMQDHGCYDCARREEVERG